MKKLIAIIALFAVGCTPLQARQVSNALHKAAEVTEAVCSAAPLFELIEAPAPNVETCEHTARTLSREEYEILVEALDCIADNDTRAEQVDCLLIRTSWPDLARKFRY